MEEWLPEIDANEDLCALLPVFLFTPFDITLFNTFLLEFFNWESSEIWDLDLVPFSPVRLATVLTGYLSMLLSMTSVLAPLAGNERLWERTRLFGRGDWAKPVKVGFSLASLLFFEEPTAVPGSWSELQIH